MPTTEKTLTLVGDLKKSTHLQRTHALASFSIPVTVKEQTVFERTLAPDESISVPFAGMLAASMIFILLDDQLDGELEIALNGSIDYVPLGLGMFMAGTSVTSMSIRNSSINEGAFTAYLGGN